MKQRPQKRSSWGPGEGDGVAIGIRSALTRTPHDTPDTPRGGTRGAPSGPPSDGRLVSCPSHKRSPIIMDQSQSNIAPAPFKPAERFKVACRMLRQAGHLDAPLPGQRRGESAVDWLVRLSLAQDSRAAAEMLILGRGLQPLLNELTGSTYK